MLWRRQPGFPVCLIGQNDGNGLGMDGRDNRIGFGREKPEQIVGRLAIPHLAHRLPSGNVKPRKEGRAVVGLGEPDIATVRCQAPQRR